jgi:2-phosphosulfolactate phosphatase
MDLDVLFTPSCVGELDISGWRCAVVDVLRATSTMITALASGAVAVYPCVDIAEAREGAARCPQDSGLLGGEERGEMIPGFDLGNSPLEYADRGLVAGKAIFSYTTNGTGAIRRAYDGSGLPVYVASLLNLSAVSSAMLEDAGASPPRGLAVICAGRYGRPSLEDIFCAGLIVEKLAGAPREKGERPQLRDGAQIAAGLAAAGESHSLDVLTSSEHGRFLESIGFAEDLQFASRVDEYPIAPVFDGERVVLARSDA